MHVEAVEHKFEPWSVACVCVCRGRERKEGSGEFWKDSFQCVWPQWLCLSTWSGGGGRQIWPLLAQTTLTLSDRSKSNLPRVRRGGESDIPCHYRVCVSTKVSKVNYLLSALSSRLIGDGDELASSTPRWRQHKDVNSTDSFARLSFDGEQLSLVASATWSVDWLAFTVNSQQTDDGMLEYFEPQIEMWASSWPPLFILFLQRIFRMKVSISRALM